jgi:hypothetical protein
VQGSVPTQCGIGLNIDHGARQQIDGLLIQAFEEGDMEGVKYASIHSVP